MDWTKARDVLWSRRETLHFDRRHRPSQLCFCALQTTMFWESRHRAWNIIHKKNLIVRKESGVFLCSKFILIVLSLVAPPQPPESYFIYLGIF